MQNLDYPEDTYVIAVVFTDNADLTYLFSSTISSPLNGEDVFTEIFVQYSYQSFL